MAWIESHQALERHPKTLQVKSAMGWDLDTTIGKLHRFWWWCVDYAESGDLRKHNDTTLGSAVGLNDQDSKQFVQAMVEAGFLERLPYFRIHDWWQYTGRFLQVKYKASPERWQAVRHAYSKACSDCDDSRTNNPASNGSPGGSKAHNQPTNQPKPTNQPTPGGGGAGGEEAEAPEAMLAIVAEIKRKDPSVKYPEAAAKKWLDNRENWPKRVDMCALWQLCLIGRVRSVAGVEVKKPVSWNDRWLEVCGERIDRDRITFANIELAEVPHA